MITAVSVSKIIDAKVASSLKLKDPSHSVYVFLQSLYDDYDNDLVKIQNIKKALEVANNFIYFVSIIFNSDFLNEQNCIIL